MQLNCTPDLTPRLINFIFTIIIIIIHIIIVIIFESKPSECLSDPEGWTDQFSTDFTSALKIGTGSLHFHLQIKKIHLYIKFFLEKKINSIYKSKKIWRTSTTDSIWQYKNKLTNNKNPSTNTQNYWTERNPYAKMCGISLFRLLSFKFLLIFGGLGFGKFSLGKRILGMHIVWALYHVYVVVI